MKSLLIRTSLVAIALTVNTGLFAAATETVAPTPAPTTTPAAPTAAAPASSQQDPNMVVATINGEKIILAKVLETLKSLPPQVQELPLEKIYEAVLNRVVDMMLITKAATTAGLQNDADVQRKIKECQEAMLQKSFLDKEIAKLITPEIIKERYNQLVEMIKKQPAEEEIRLRHILVKTKDEAQKIIKELKSGAKFEELAKKHSLDEPTKVNGGDLGYVRKGDMPKAFAEKVFKAAKATLVPEPIEVEGLGFSVVRVEDKRKVPVPTQEEVSGEIAKAITPEMAVKVIEKLRKDMKVEKFGLDGKPLVEKKAEETKEPAKAAAAAASAKEEKKEEAAAPTKESDKKEEVAAPTKEEEKVAEPAKAAAAA